MLKEHNLDSAIVASNIASLSELDLDPTLSTLPTLSTPSMLNLDSTSNLNSTFNINADTVAKPTIAPTEATKPTEPIEPTVVAPTNSILEEEEAAMSLDQLLDRGYEKDFILNRVLDLLARGANYSRDLTIADCFVVNRRLHYRGLLYVPDYHALQMHLCKIYHNTPVADHLGIGNTYELLHRSYYWLNMQSFVRKYVRHCHVCKCSKGSRFKKQDVLQPLPVPQQRWQDLIINLMTGIPEVHGHNAICCVVDRLSKERHYIATTKELYAERLANLFLKHIWKHHGLPSSIVSNRGSQFISDFWGFLCKRLGITIQLLTAWHPETNGQTERVNSVIEQYLRAFVNYLHDDWLDWLPLAEFVGNNTESKTTKVTPFFANKDFHPRMGVEPNIQPPTNANELNADVFATCMEKFQNVLRNHILLAQADYEKHANRHRGTAPQYRESDLAWLDT